MDLTPLVKENAQILQSYAGGRFRVSGQVFDYPILVYPSQTLKWDVPLGSGVADLCAEDFLKIRIAAPDGLDVILFGSGGKIQFLEPAVKQDLRAQGMHVDIMDTGAACRTYNVLMAEGRRVVAALLPTPAA